MKIFFDGGCRPNPGPIEIAAVIGGANHVRTDVAMGDNNAAEWLALLFALELAVRAGVADAILLGDSALVTGQAQGRVPCRSAHLRPHLAAFRLAAASIPRLRVRLIPRAQNLAGIVLDRRMR